MDFEDDWKLLKRNAPFKPNEPELDAADDWDELRGRLTWYAALFDEDQRLLPETKGIYRKSLPSLLWMVPHKPAHYVGYWSRLDELKLSKLSEILEPGRMMRAVHIADGTVREVISASNNSIIWTTTGTNVALSNTITSSTSSTFTITWTT